MSRKSVIGLLIAVLMVVSSVVSISALSSEITASGEIGTVVPMSIPSEIFWNDHYGPYELYDPSDLNNPEAEMAYTEAFRTIFYEGGYYEEYSDQTSHTCLKVYLNGVLTWTLYDAGDTNGNSMATKNGLLNYTQYTITASSYGSNDPCPN